MKPRRDRAWLFVLPVVLVVAFNALLPLMTVVNYSVQDILGPDTRPFVGVEWFRKVLRDPALHDAFQRQFLFSGAVLALEVPLGLMLALCIPRKGAAHTLALVVLAMPLLIPWNVVGTIWQMFARGDIGLMGVAINAAGIEYNYTAHARDAWLTVLLVDVWHWTPLVALLCFAGLRAIPEPYYQAAAIDGAGGWAIFRHVQLPRLRGVLTIAVLLRFMDSFMIYTEPFVITGGGPGNSTNFPSIILSRLATGQFDLGHAAALSLVYFLLVLLFCWLFYTVMTREPA